MSYERRDARGRHNGRYRAEGRFKHPDGSETRWRKTFASKVEADKAEAIYNATGEPPKSGDVAGVTFGEMADMFTRAHPDWKTYANHQRLRASVTYLGDKDVAGIRLGELERFVDWLRAKGRSNRTIRCYVNVVFRVLRYAHRKELIVGLPSRPEVPDTGEEREALPYETERRIVQWMVEHGHEAEATVVCLLASTGMRVRELLGLRVEQIGDNGIDLKREQTKARKARWVPLVPHLANELRVLLREKRMPNYTNMRRIWMKSVDAVGDGTEYVMHCLRHATNTRLYDEGFQDARIRLYMGHSAGKNMSMRYDHPTKATLLAMAEKVQHGVGELLQTAEIVPLKSLDKSAAN